MDISKHRDTDDKSHGNTLKYHSPGLGTRGKNEETLTKSNFKSGWSNVYTAALISPRTLADNTRQDNLAQATSHQPGKNTVTVSAYLANAVLLF